MSEQYFLNCHVILSTYDNDWPKIFDKEKAKILYVIGGKNVVVEHIGSTAVPKISAKPIVDIMVGTKDILTSNNCIKPLESIGYEYVPKLEKSFPKRRFLHKGPNSPNRHFHLHMVKIDSFFWQRQLFFRDYLRKNKDSAIAYQSLKEKLAKVFVNDVFSYTEAKSDFIQEILTKCHN
ncbi:GrpB family protein [Lentisphaerota bacterium ZTH]|nr:GrpB family protein [Lentisphaerota bacterium]WET06067.1 GrpB family protein [Lentisphaerota bacterium ZTH]